MTGNKKTIAAARWRLAAGLFLATALAACQGGGESKAPASSGVVAGMSKERLAHLDSHFHRLVDEGKIAGVVSWVARHGEVVHEDAYGAADIEAGRAMTPDAYFYVYSMTKPITSVALLMLYEEGRFQLSDPVARYLPELANLKLYAGEGPGGKMILKDPARQPTIQDVFRHTAGFQYGPAGNRGIDEAYRKADVMGGTLADLTKRLGTLPLAYEPGTRWVYSVSHDVQARLVEVLSGIPFDEFVRTRIFEPLGMKNSVFGRPDALKDRFAAIYTVGQDGKLAPNGALDAPGAATRVLGGFSISTTAADYGRFAQMLVNSGELDGVRLLSRKTIDLMDSNHLPAGVMRGAAGGGSAGGEGYGLGVRVVLDPAQAGNLTSAGTFGWSGAAGTHFFVDRAEDLVAVFMVQRMGGADGPGMAAQFETLVYQAIVD
ncbi:MAG TPA: serine hydrolase domain-containing protein [Steroidobacteraceae bacterium]|nr:serine hydrolase domain-containing protein [Steroidobacteraceae bacterium]